VTCSVSMLSQVHLECPDYLDHRDFRDFRAWQDPQEFLASLDPLALVETTVCNCNFFYFFNHINVYFNLVSI